MAGPHSRGHKLLCEYPIGQQLGPNGWDIHRGAVRHTAALMRGDQPSCPTQLLAFMYLEIGSSR